MPALRTAQTTITREQALSWMRVPESDLEPLFAQARAIRAARTGTVVTYSRKIFLPLTNLCRDRCGYCTFARAIGDPTAHTMTPDEILAVAEAGRRAGCKEALFSLGDKPELRYPEHRAWLERHGFQSTLEYVAAICRLVFDRTGLLPHANPGVLSAADIELLKPVNASLGIMLESTSTRLLEPGQAHYACPDKVPAVRLRTIAAAGRAGVPFTTGILIGIGETLEDRIDSLVAIADLHREYGHIQEVIIQNFRAKPDTAFADRSEPEAVDLARTVAVARLLLDDSIAVQAPPNLSPQALRLLLDAGINDWGGISPVTRDFINPGHAWPALTSLRQVTEEAGLELRERLPIYPDFTRSQQWIPELLQDAVAGLTDHKGLVRREQEQW